MDQHWFDQLARRLGRVRDRRGVLRAGLSALAITVGCGRGVAGQEAGCADGCPEEHVCRDGACVRPCTKKGECRSKHDDPCIYSDCVDGLCVSAIVDCMPGYECCKGKCCEKGCMTDSECAVFDPCLWGQCGPEGRCVFTRLDPCFVCSSDEECVERGRGAICCEGTCQRPCPEGTVMGKACECQATGAANLDGLVVHDDASG
jgi:hypothetical protein